MLKPVGDHILQNHCLLCSSSNITDLTLFFFYFLCTIDSCHKCIQHSQKVTKHAGKVAKMLTKISLLMKDWQKTFQNTKISTTAGRNILNGTFNTGTKGWRISS